VNLDGLGIGDLMPLVVECIREQRRNIINEMPTGTHKARAIAWRVLADRCLKAAKKHEAVAERRREVRAYAGNFAPEFRESAIRTKYGLPALETYKKHDAPKKP